MGVRYARDGEHFTWAGDFHGRPRLPGRDVDVCFGGRIAVSEVHLHPAA
jgi:5'-nucleotidase